VPCQQLLPHQPHQPQLPPQPSSPHSLPSQSGVQQELSTHTCTPGQPPQLPPQPSPPHSLPLQSGAQHELLWHTSPPGQPQSAGQEEQVSALLGWHEPLPQDGITQPPQSCMHSLTQMVSHWFWQQYGSIWQTHASQGQPPQPL